LGGSVVLYAVLFSWLPETTAWRVMFMAGLLPALLVFYVRRAVPEPALSLESRARRTPGRSGLFAIFRPGVLRVTLIGGLLGVVRTAATTR